MHAKKVIFVITSFFFLSFNNQKLQKEKKIIMAVFAHADDETVTNVSSLLVKYAREGHIVYLVIATKGELGVTKHANIPAGDSLTKVRAIEAACLCEKLGIQPPVLLGLGDGSLANFLTASSLHNKLDSLFILYKPNVVITWGADGGYGHMDHRVVHNVVTELFQSGQYANPSKLFYIGIPTENWKLPLNFKSDIKGMYQDWKTVKKAYLTTRIKCNKQDIDKAISAMYCYNSQFSKEQMEDNKLWMSNITKDTVYLRPFIQQQKIIYNLFQ